MVLPFELGVEGAGGSLLVDLKLITSIGRHRG